MFSLRRLFRSASPAVPATIQASDACVSRARQALDAGDAETALTALGEAKLLTPLREDLRPLILEALAMRDLRAGGASRASASAKEKTAGAEPETVSAPRVFVPPAAAPPAPVASGRKALKRVPAPTADIAAPALPAAPAASRKSFPAPGPTEPLAAPARLAGAAPRVNPLALVATICVLLLIAISGVWATKVAFSTSALGESQTAAASAPPAEPPAELLAEIREARREVEAAQAQKAITRLRAALDRWPAQTRLLDPELAEACFREGDRLERAQNYKEAIAFYDKALALNSSHTAAQRSKGWCYFMMGRAAQNSRETARARELFNQALAAYETAVTLDPHDARAWLGKARVHAAQSDRDAAVRSYRAAIANAPDSPEATEASRRLAELLGDRS